MLTYHIPLSSTALPLCGQAGLCIPTRPFYTDTNCRACRLLYFTHTPRFHARREPDSTLYCGMSREEAEQQGEAWSIPRYYGSAETFASFLTCDECYQLFRGEHLDAQSPEAQASHEEATSSG